MIIHNSASFSVAYSAIETPNGLITSLPLNLTVSTRTYATFNDDPQTVEEKSALELNTLCALFNNACLAEAKDDVNSYKEHSRRGERFILFPVFPTKAILAAVFFKQLNLYNSGLVSVTIHDVEVDSYDIIDAETELSLSLTDCFTVVE